MNGGAFTTFTFFDATGGGSRLRGSRSQLRLAFGCEIPSRGNGRGSFIRPLINVTPAEAANLLDGIVSVNLAQMDRAYGGKRIGLGAQSPMPILTGIQRGTVRYCRFDPEEEWKLWSQLAGEVRKNGIATGDCEDLVCAVVAELIYAGVNARSYVVRSGKSLYHVLIKTDRWGLLDPSRAAGMI